MSNRKKAAIATVLIMAIALRLSWLAQASLAQVSPKQAQSVQPERVLVGAYDAAHVNGLVFISGQQNAVEQNLFGLRFLAFQKSNPAYPEESPRSFELGAHAPDGSYARVDWQPQFDPTLTITLRWSRIGKQAVAGLEVCRLGDDPAIVDQTRVQGMVLDHQTRCRRRSSGRPAPC